MLRSIIVKHIDFEMQRIEKQSLTREQKEAIGLLSVGTFLEFFDLMLFIHMAVLLNDLFFPKTDPLTASLLSAFAFCSAYIFRPIGALFFGWLGDSIGRKVTVTITTMMMAVSCVTVASIPTYEDIGITAAYLITICRIVQGLSSIGEIVGAELYLTEITKPPIQYPVVSLIEVIAVTGATVALCIAAFTISFGLNWRYAFWVGAIIAVIGAVARNSLRETTDFIDAKRCLQNRVKDIDNNFSTTTDENLYLGKLDKKSVLAYFFMDCCWPFFFYFTYIYCASIYKNSFNYDISKILQQNILVSLVQIIAWLILAFLSYRIHPLKILKTRLFIFLPFMCLLPLIMDNIKDPLYLLFVQIFIAGFAITTTPAIAVIFSHFTIFKRFTCSSMVYALSRAFIYLINSFGLVYLVDYFGYYGLLIITVPLIIGYVYGFTYFCKLEREVGNYY